MLRNDLKECIDDTLLQALYNILGTEGRQIVLNKVKWENALLHAGVGEADRDYLLRLMDTKGYLAFVCANPDNPGMEIERLMQNASEESAMMPYAKRYIATLGMALGLFSVSEKAEFLEYPIKRVIEENVIGSFQLSPTQGDEAFQKKELNHYGLAYGYYTVPGAIALTDTRRQRVLGMLNYSIYNSTILRKSVLLFIVLSIIQFFPVGGKLYPVRPVLGVFISIVQLGMLVVGFAIQKHRKFVSTLWIPTSIFLLWCFGVLCRFI